MATTGQIFLTTATTVAALIVATGATANELGSNIIAFPGEPQLAEKPKPAVEPTSNPDIIPVPNIPIESRLWGGNPGGVFDYNTQISMLKGEMELIASLPANPPVVATEPAPEPEPPATPTEPIQEAVADTDQVIDFSLSTLATSVEVATTPPEQVATAVPGLQAWFEGAENSLVAKAIGAAEGTRTPNGDRTNAYYGHVDPGNGVWNIGSFSYQHGANSPEEADVKQLQRLKQAAVKIQGSADFYGMTLTQAEWLNALDLFNQAPIAAVGKGNFIDWLKKAKDQGLTGDEAILWARTRSYIDPETQRWNAPGLGNNVNTITRDQERRMKMITKAIAAYGAQPEPEQSSKPLSRSSIAMSAALHVAVASVQ